jgi:hypothetical protein
VGGSAEMVAGIKGIKGAKVRARARRARAVGFVYWLSKINAHLDQWQYKAVDTDGG